MVVGPEDGAVRLFDAAVGQHVDFDPVDEERMLTAAVLFELAGEPSEIVPAADLGSDVDVPGGPLGDRPINPSDRIVRAVAPTTR
ncbi:MULTISPECIES: hypothetical protein [unclassified Amycolatopsis]|uniref:hypothetical protein n=1 Tax=unclassified Amycolatopsis TaxID=2618356 RepID=UPI002E1A8394|nr:MULTISPECIES: hypothetical protein [unclassified Amycolatopsis]